MSWPSHCDLQAEQQFGAAGAGAGGGIRILLIGDRRSEELIGLVGAGAAAGMASARCSNFAEAFLPPATGGVHVGERTGMAGTEMVVTEREWPGG